MKVEVQQLHPIQWKELSEKAHSIVFQEKKPSAWDRIDFTLVVSRNQQLMGYVTCREHDAKTLYWQFGGAFPGTKDSSWTFPGYTAFVEWCRARYDRITTLIENSNTVMLKMAMKVGFRIIGIRYYKSQVLLEHVLEFSDAI